ncbi:MAG: ATP-binding protein [Thermodesulfobacteriota bacterium]|nr:ATP-binding protein [Thermodesulfobacteriota bacterium]
MEIRIPRRTSGITPGRMGADKNEFFVLRKCAIYLTRHLNRYHSFNDETLQMVCWTLGNDMKKIGKFLFAQLSSSQRKMFSEEFDDAGEKHDDYAYAVDKVLKKIKKKDSRKFENFIIQLLDQRFKSLNYRGMSEIEKNLASFRKMFKLSDNEIELCTFLFLLKTFDEPESFFEDYLNCNKFRGQKYLLNILRISYNSLTSSMKKINKIGIIDIDRHDFELNDDFVCILQNPSAKTFSTQLYFRIKSSTIPLGYHSTYKDKTAHILKLLEKKQNLPTHILFYGPPGTGKTSFSHGIVNKLGIPAYEIAREIKNESISRRAGLVACMNMANTGQGSLIIVDEADNMLNTMGSWFMRGETQDKGWLNHFLEEPGARVIWITNSIDNIEDSVLRRFAFSLYFRPFNMRQRIKLWDGILRINKAKRHFNRPDIEYFAKKYSVNAGTIDLAVKKAIETNSGSKKNIQKAVKISLESYQALKNSGREPVNRDKVEKNYTVDGLNTDGNINEMLVQLEQFNRYLLHAKDERRLNFNLLFYGPPGTGKSELARYIADRLDREIICKRYSDLQSMYVGGGEKNIKSAFEEAEAEESILIIDEADSMLFSRDSARQSWEISFTNEFLTQMERFKGILICTTNRLKALDDASIRRFNHKIGFDYLEPDGNVIFYKKLLSPLTKTHLDKANEVLLKRITCLAPGDFKIIKDRFSFYSPEDVSTENLVQALQEVDRIKKIQSGDKPIGF